MDDRKWVIPLADRVEISPKEDIMLLCTFLAIFSGLGIWICYASYMDGIMTNFIVMLSVTICILGFIGYWYGHNIYEIVSSNKAYKHTVVYREDELLLLYDHKNRVTRIPYHDVIMVEGRPKSLFAVGPMVASYRDNSYGKLIFYCQSNGRSYKMKVKYVKAPYETASKIIAFYTNNDRTYDTEDEFKAD